MKKHFSLMSTIIIFAVLLALSLLSSLLQYASDSIRFATGKLETTFLTVNDFETKDFVTLENGNLLSTSPDPWLTINEYNKPSTMLILSFNASEYPGEVNLYYTCKNEDYNTTQKIWGKARNGGTYEFIMPRGIIRNIRIDPSSTSGIEIDLKSVVINPRRSFLSYFMYSGESIFWFFAIGTMLCCFVACVAEQWPSCKNIGKVFALIKRKKPTQH